MVDLFETELVAERVLVKISAPYEPSVLVRRERIPLLPAVRAAHAHQSQTTRVRWRVMNLVDRDIRKQGGLR